MVDKWLKTPQDEQIPLMKHMFDYTIHAILAAVYGCDDHHRINSVHDSYKVVSFLLMVFSLSTLYASPLSLSLFQRHYDEMYVFN